MRKKVEVQTVKLSPGWTEQKGVRLRCDGCNKHQGFEDKVYWRFSGAGEKRKKTTVYCQKCAKEKEIIL